MPDDPRIATAIRAFLDRHGWTQRRFAREVEMTEAAVNALVHGRTEPRNPRLFQLALRGLEEEVAGASETLMQRPP